MVELAPIFKKAYWTLAAGGLAYVLLICALTIPSVQRYALYMHWVNPTQWQDLREVENFGFLKTQVQAFYLKTPDNETLYAWHILPIHVAREHEELLNEHWKPEPAEDYQSTVAYKLLAEDPKARVVVSFHGNAAHIASQRRPTMYRMALSVSTPQDPVHVFAIDYRGFGLSTGTPTEEGLITDGVTLLNMLASPPLNIPPSRIVLSGLSLGTAVTTAVAERFAFGAPENAIAQPALRNPEPFAGIILLASFSNIPDLLDSYSLMGVVPPIFSGFVGYPWFKNWAKSKILDRWETSRRLARLTGIAPNNTDADAAHAQRAVDITIVHARNDAEIPWRDGFANWKAATGFRSTPDGYTLDDGKVVYERITEGGQTERRVWEKEVAAATGSSKAQVKRVRWEKVAYGGHDQLGTYSVAALAILRSFEE